MNRTRREFVHQSAFGIFGAQAAKRGAADDGHAKRPSAALRAPFFNQDSTEFFYTRQPGQVTGEAVDAWVDLLAEAGVGTLVSNVGAMRANYASKVWEPDWFGYDPQGPDDQP